MYIFYCFKILQNLVKWALTEMDFYFFVSDLVQVIHK